MVNLRKRPSKAPTSRVYNSTRVPRQQHFAPPAHHAHPHHSNTASRRKARQSTLTQLDFAYSEDDLDLNATRPEPETSAEDSQEDEERAHSRKRRKTNKALTEAERRRQQTLTQMDGFLMRGDKVDENGEFVVMETESESEDTRAQCDWHNSFLDTKDNHQVAGEGEDGPSTSHFSIKQSHHSSPMSTRRRPRASSPQTPTKRIKTEVPSSQSPAGTPLTMESTPSPQKAETRTPLQEIHPNVLAMRDSISASADKSSKGKRKRSQTEPTPEESDAYLSDNENYMPDSDDDLESQDYEIESPTKSIKKRYFRPSQRKAPALCGPDFTIPKCKQETSPNYFHQPVRSSQTTVPEEASSPRRLRISPLRRSTLARDNHDDDEQAIPSSPPSPSPIPAKFRHAMPMTLDSQPPPHIFSDVTQVASINDSADIVTMSQLMPSSAVE